jgi:hypothetical protein
MFAFATHLEGNLTDCVSAANTNGIHVNGNGPHNSRKGKWSLQNGSAQKRPATAYMDDDDDMFSSPTRRMSNGHVNGANSPHKKQRKNGINRPSLQEQREALPIWKGMSSYQMFFSTNFMFAPRRERNSRPRDSCERYRRYSGRNRKWQNYAYVVPHSILTKYLMSSLTLA